MVPGPSADTGTLPVEARGELLRVAREAIVAGLRTRPLVPDPREYPPVLREHRASFVTLYRQEQLRGCIGSLEARDPLVMDVARNAWSAASRDPRFDPVATAEIGALEIHISVLTPAEAVTVASETELLSRLRPGIDGLILEEGSRRGTFLPSVWEQLPEPRDFLRQLKRKAGLPDHYWSDAIRVSRYTTESFS